MGSGRKGTVVRLPRLPHLPAPPRPVLDRRQDQFRRIVAGLAGATDRRGATINLLSGYPAAAVNVGDLKDALERGLARFDMHAVRNRWEEDVRDWLLRTIRAWTQRCKLLQLRR